MKKYHVARTALVLAFASALAACRDSLLPAEHPAVCPESPSTAMAAPDASAVSLFMLEAEPVLTADQQRLIASIRNRSTTARVEIARLVENPAAHLQLGRKITFNVSATRSFTALGEQVHRRAPDEMYWSGGLVGNHGHVHLVLTGSGVTASLQSIAIQGPDAAYSIEPIGNRLHAMVCIDPSRFPPD